MTIGSDNSTHGFLTMRFNDDDIGGHIRIQGSTGSGNKTLNLMSTNKYMDSMVSWSRVEMGNSNANKVRLYVNNELVTYYSSIAWNDNALHSNFIGEQTEIELRLMLSQMEVNRLIIIMQNFIL